MIEAFQPGGIATLIGSLPLADHGAAIDLILKHTPEIPFWAQLPVHKEEGMVQVKQVAALGIDMQKLINQSIITPGCGMGSLGLDYAEKVISLTKAVSRKARSLFPK